MPEHELSEAEREAMEAAMDAVTVGKVTRTAFQVGYLAARDFYSKPLRVTDEMVEVLAKRLAEERCINWDKAIDWAQNGLRTCARWHLEAALAVASPAEPEPGSEIAKRLLDEVARLLHVMGCVEDCAEPPENWRENAQLVLEAVIATADLLSHGEAAVASPAADESPRELALRAALPDPESLLLIAQWLDEHDGGEDVEARAIQYVEAGDGKQAVADLRLWAHRAAAIASPVVMPNMQGDGEGRKQEIDDCLEIDARVIAQARAAYEKGNHSENVRMEAAIRAADQERWITVERKPGNRRVMRWASCWLTLSLEEPDAVSPAPDSKRLPLPGINATAAVGDETAVASPARETHALKGRDFNAECEQRPGVSIGEDLSDQLLASTVRELTSRVRAEQLVKLEFEARARERALRDALPDPEKLLLLAESDLRMWASRAAAVASPVEEPAAGEEICRRCGGPNPQWCAPSPLWNAVMRGRSIDGPSEFGEIICPTCFMVLAEERGVARGWRVEATTVNVELETVTPTGRVWDADRWLWSEVEEPAADLRVRRCERCCGRGRWSDDDSYTDDAGGRPEYRCNECDGTGTRAERRSGEERRKGNRRQTTSYNHPRGGRKIDRRSGVDRRAAPEEDKDA